MDATVFRWVAPDGGPAPTAAKTAEYAAQHLQDAKSIFCNPRDLAALRVTLIGERVGLPTGAGVVQAGTVWVACADEVTV